MTKAIQLIISIFICQLAGIIGSVATVSSVNSWFTTLNKPSFNPPGWLFGPVWITLYTVMGISLYLIYQKGFEKKEVKFAIYLFIFHLVINALWSLIFFGLKNPGLAFFEIIILWILIVVLIILFWRINRTASILLIPYLLWVSFATVLNYSIWQLN